MTSGRDDSGGAGVPGDPAGPDHGTQSPHRTGHDEARGRFGGINWGAGFFGWLVAMAMALIVAAVVGAVAAGIGAEAGFTQSDAEREAGTISLTAGVVLMVVLAIAWFVGGYVAGRMSRFDGGKQGLAVWLIGVLVALLTAALGVIFGAETDILDRLRLPRIELSADQLTWAATAAVLATLLVTLLAAMVGGKVGHRYHDRVDRVAHR